MWHDSTLPSKSGREEEEDVGLCSHQMISLMKELQIILEDEINASMEWMSNYKNSRCVDNQIFIQHM